MSFRSIPDSRFRALLSDCTKCLVQQMFFWGRDVIHPEGNLLCDHGFERSPSPGLQGTSCYRLPWKEGFIELHGACAGWYRRPEESTQESFVFIRPLNRVYRYSGESAPIPGEWERVHLNRGQPHQIYQASTTFLEWWLAYEGWIERRAKMGYRDCCHHVYQKLPASRHWLPPQESIAWVRKFLADPSKAPRALK
ncbi:MAG: hypothetical protein AAF191_13220 [Verrucomicrobiota bacterium]